MPNFQVPGKLPGAIHGETGVEIGYRVGESIVERPVDIRLPIYANLQLVANDQRVVRRPTVFQPVGSAEAIGRNEIDRTIGVVESLVKRDIGSQGENGRAR